MLKVKIWVLYPQISKSRYLDPHKDPGDTQQCYKENR